MTAEYKTTITKCCSECFFISQETYVQKFGTEEF